MGLAQSIGAVSLNISFVLYLIVYIPQLFHNQKTEHIAQLSLLLHFLLYLSYFFDLIYGVASALPWQYKTVSCVGLVLVVVQHLQLIQFFFTRKWVGLARFSMVFLIINSLLIAYYFLIFSGVLEHQSILILGALARICGIIYCMPQILKNRVSKSAKAISLYFVYINLMLALLDTLSSWCLNWGWPNKLASPISVILMLTILWQSKNYQNSDVGWAKRSAAQH